MLQALQALILPPPARAPAAFQAGAPTTAFERRLQRARQQRMRRFVRLRSPSLPLQKIKLSGWG
jgi:hypothetical protein